jgi:hypothetical protein
LLLAHARILAGALGLDQPQRLAVRPPQHVIDEANTLVICHALDAELSIVGLIERPAGLAQQQIDIAVAGLGLVVIVRIRLGLGGLARGGDGGAKLLQFLIDVLLVGKKFC